MAAKSLARSWGPTLWTLATLAACAALATLFATTSIEAERGIAGALRGLGANACAAPEGGADAAAWSAFDEESRRAGADALRLDARVVVVAGRPIAAVAADPAALARMTSYWSIEGRRAGAPTEIVAGRRAAASLAANVGDRLALVGADGAAHDFDLVGIAECGDEDDDRLFVAAFPTAATARAPALPAGHPPIDVVSTKCAACHGSDDPSRRATSAKSTSAADLQYALLRVPNGLAGVESLAASLRRRDAAIDVRPMRAVIRGEDAVLAKVNLLSGLTLAAVVALASLSVCAAVAARVVERRKELALLQALGAKRVSVAALLVVECAAVGLVASAVGFAAGGACVHAVLRQVFGVDGGPGATALGAALAVTMGVSLLAACVACGRALRLAPAPALRGE